MFLAIQIDKAKIMPEKPKTKQTCNSAFHYVLLFKKIILLQSDTKALKIMFPAAKNDWAKNAKNKAKNKTNLL